MDRKKEREREREARTEKDKTRMKEAQAGEREESRVLTGVPCCGVGNCGKGTTACGKVQELLSLSVGHVTDHTPKHPGMKTGKNL